MERKEREEDRDHHNSSHRKRRHRSPSKSRSRSREREDLSRSKKGRNETGNKSKSANYERSKENGDRNREVKEKDRNKRVKEEKEEKPIKEERIAEEEIVPTTSGAESSLSIEETNRIRAELGLKPLEVGDGSSSTSKKEDVHVPAENIREKKQTEEIRRKLEERKEKRKLEQKLLNVKTLGDVTGEDDDNAANWVERSRRIQKEKEEAQKRAKLLEEMDEVFGVGDMVSQEIKKVKDKAYTSKDLRGLKVEHDREVLQEGKEVILTLKDQNILQEEGDVLVNVNLIDEERYKKNNEIKKQKPGYQPFEEDQVDELGLPKTKSLLAKYDAEIAGEKRDSFILGKEGDEEAKLKAREALKEKLKLQQKQVISLETAPLRIASEYFTTEEMTSFKKVKRRVKKVRKSETILKADDLLQGANQEETTSDLGSRNRKIKKELEEDEAPAVDLSGVKITFDESHVDDRQALLRAKKSKERKKLWDIGEVVKTIKVEPMDESEPVDEDHARSSIVLNATAEFCRTLGDIPTYGMAGNRDEDEDELMDFERQLAEERKRNQEKEERKREAERLQERGGWNVLDGDQDRMSVDSMDMDSNEKESNTVILDEEPDVGAGMAAALKLAMSKGYLEKEEKKRIVVSKAAQELQAQRYTIEDKAAEDDKYSRRNRFDGPVTEFKEKEGYKPDPKLEYMDDNGKPMTTKEAFRHLSHKFHGKGSGKLKSEKRSKKQDEKMLMNRMSSTDTPLNTLKKLQDKQKELQTPYIVLSGKLASTSIAKPSKGKKP